MDVTKRFENMRLTEEEQFAAAQYFLGKVTPVDDQPVELVSFFDIYDQAEELAAKGDTMVGLSTGYRSLDAMTKGLGPGELITVYGYTSMGKSQLSQNIALNVAKAGQGVLFIGLELTNVQNASRLLKMNGRENSADLPFLFPSSPDIKYTDIARLISSAKPNNLGLVVVDQLQDLIHSTSNEQGEIGQIMAELKRAAIVNEVPIIVVSHVNRQGASTGPPPLETLKGSASIEQKTDIALAVWQDHEADLIPDYGEMQVALRKNRQRGMSHKFTKLIIKSTMRLEEEQKPQVLTGL